MNDNRHRTAFTLVEVILAILIISGIMTVLLYFYHRAVQVRQAALEQAEFLSTTRMIFEQITTELRSARVVEDQMIGLEGTSNSISFVCTSIPQMARWITSTNETVILPPATDLKRVTYTLLEGTNTLAPKGVDRVEQLLLDAAFTSGTNATEFVTPAESNLVTETEPILSYTTNQFVRARPPLTDRVQFLRFRYWGETNWYESWFGLDLPAGVEVTMGQDPMPADATEGYPFEIFRRVIYLPFSTHASNRVVLDETDEFFP